MPFTILGTRVDAVQLSSVQTTLRQWLTTHPTTPKLVFTPNPEILVYAYRHKPYQAILNRADLNLPDGQGIVLLFGKQFPERVTGTDVLRSLLTMVQQQQLSVGVVYKPGGLSTRAELIEALKVYTRQVEVITPAERFVNRPAVVIVCLGFPEQEQWLVQNQSQLSGCHLAMAVGGGMDFLTGRQQRAPLLFQRLRLEWLWRLLLQPHRLGRIVTAVIIFPYLVLTTRRS